MKEIEMLIQTGYGKRIPGNFPIYVGGFSFCLEHDENFKRLRFEDLCDSFYEIKGVIEKKLKDY